jgi:acetyltransferase-like isoleucine patch superfamily enzyme
MLLLRLVFYQILVFIWHKPLHRTTRIYGRLLVPTVPCHLDAGIRCGFGDSVFFSTGSNAVIRLGDDVTFNNGCIIVASEEIHIGSRVAVGEYVSIRDQQHIHVPGLGVRDQGFQVAPIHIGDNCWIGRGAFIGPGTIIGKDCVIAANSVVHGQFPEGVLIAGAPATVKRQLVASAA